MLLNENCQNLQFYGTSKDKCDFFSEIWILGTLTENSINQLTLFCLSPTAVATSSYLVVQNVSGQSLQFGNTGCGVFNGGIQN